MDKRKIRIIFIVIFTILVIGSGLFVYFRFIKGTNNGSHVYDKVYKTEDGKSLKIRTFDNEEIIKKVTPILRERYLKVCSEEKNNESDEYKLNYCEAAKNDTLTLWDYANRIYNYITESNNWYFYERHELSKSSIGIPDEPIHNMTREYALFDDKIIAIHSYELGINYSVYMGNEIDDNTSYPYQYYFLIDDNNSKVIQYNEEVHILHNIRDSHISEITYFAKKDSNSYKYKVYTSDFKYLGDILTFSNNYVDTSDMVYVINDGIISKFNKNGDKVDSLPSIGQVLDFMIYKDNPLALILQDDSLYMYDYTTKNKILLSKNGGYENNQLLRDVCFFESDRGNIEKGEIVITLADKSDLFSENLLNTRTLIYDYGTKEFKETEYSQIYKNDKLKIELSDGGIETDENGNRIQKYFLYIDGKTLEVESRENDQYSRILIVKNKNNIYVLDTVNMKILANYTSKNEVTYDNYQVRNADSNYSFVNWFFIYNGDYHEDGSLALIVNEIEGTIVESKGESVNYSVGYDMVYVIYSNRVVSYSSEGKLLKTYQYENIYSSNVGLLGHRNKEDYIIKFYEELKEEKIIKDKIYTDGKDKLEVFKDNDDTYYAKYNNSEYFILENYNDSDDKLYIETSGTLTGGQGDELNFLLSKKTNTIVKFSNIGVGYIKAKNGYYFWELERSVVGECVMECGPSSIFTENWKKIGTGMGHDNIVDDEGNIYVNNDNAIVKYNLNGEELSRSEVFTELGNGIVYKNVLYAVVNGSDNNHYLYNYSDKSKIKLGKVENENISWPWVATDLEIVEDKIKIYTTSGTYEFNPATKKIVEIKDSQQ